MQFPLLEFASCRMRERYVEDERKQEIAKSPEDDDEKRKRKRGKARRGISGSRL